MRTQLTGILNGIVGHHLHRTDNPLAVRAGLCDRDENIIHGVVPSPVCIFIHGSTASNQEWMAGPDGTDYGRRLQTDLGLASMYYRYNSGLRIAQNGRILSGVLQEQIGKASTVYVIAHSMGGLIFRSAVHYADHHGQPWPRSIRQTYYLGSPHNGAPLEKAGRIIESVLEAVGHPVTKAISKVIGFRSDGIKDLGHGELFDDEHFTNDHDKDQANNEHRVSSLEKVEQLAVAATIDGDPDSWISQVFGDIMVRQSSAHDTSKEGFLESHKLVVTSTSHIGLLHSKAVGDFICRNIPESRS